MDTVKRVSVTEEQVTATIREVVAEYGADYVYPKRESFANPAACWYVVDGAPSCIVGHVLHRLGVPLESFWAFEGTSAKRVAEHLTDASWRVREALQRAQGVQDWGKTWGEALEAYEQKVMTP